MRAVDSLTAERLRELLIYVPGTGEFFWRHRPPAARFGRAGMRAGQIHLRGWRIIKIEGVMHRAGRLAWLYMTGVWPVAQVDHENLNRADDAWLNLRDATGSQQMANRGRGAKNTSGLKGVTKTQGTASRWKAQINVNGEKHYLGSFSTKEAAHAAYAAAAEKHFGAFARLA